MVSLTVVENERPVGQDVLLESPFRAKTTWVENSSLESLKASLEAELTSEIKNLLAEYQKELLKFIEPKVGECINEDEETSLESEIRRLFTPTKSIRIKSTQNKIVTLTLVVTDSYHNIKQDGNV